MALTDTLPSGSRSWRYRYRFNGKLEKVSLGHWQRYSLDDALTLRKAVLEADRKDYLLIYADQAGAKLLAEGKVREALATDRALIALHPSDAKHHVQMSSALLRVGLGEQAQKEARLATTLDPKSSTAFSQLATALEYNNIGVFVGNGFDRQAAIEAYRKAKQLDPEDVGVRTNLALLYEHNSQGDRYAEDASLSNAIREYRELKDVDKSVATRDEDNLLYAMFYNRQCHVAARLCVANHKDAAAATTVFLRTS